MPLCSDHPVPELEYVLSNSGCTSVVSSCELQHKAEKLNNVQVLRYDDLVQSGGTDSGYLSNQLMQTKDEDVALLTYTSGTTGAAQRCADHAQGSFPPSPRHVRSMEVGKRR